METLLNAVLANAILVSVLAFFVLIVERRIRRPALAHWLWVLLLVKLITPPFLPSVQSPDSSSQATAVSKPRVKPPPPPWRPNEPLPPLPPDAVPYTPARAPGSYPDLVQPLVLSAAQCVPLGWPKIVAVVWLSLSATWLAQTLVRLYRATVCLRGMTKAAEPLQERARDLGERIGIKPHQAPTVWMIPGAMSPLLWAIGGPPRLLVPRDLWDRLDGIKQDALLVHELAHLRRRDHWVRVLELAVTTLYWWCPVVWWVRRALHDAEERCCDAWVVWALPGAAKSYAAALLDTVDFLAESPPAFPLGASGLWQFRQLRGRLVLIVRGGVPKGLSRTGAVAVVGLAALMTPLRPPIFSPRTYRVTDLGSLGGPTSYPKRINNRGQVVGSSQTHSGEVHSFRTAPDRSINPATDDIGGPYGQPGWYVTNTPDGSGNIKLMGWASSGSPISINDTGQVAGAKTRDGKEIRVRDAQDQATEPETWSLGALGPTPHGGPWADAQDINAWGQIVGKSSQGGRGLWHAFRTAPNRPINPETDDLGTLGGQYSDAIAINDLGQVTGDAENPKHIHAFRTAPGRPINPATDDLGTLGGIFSRGCAINESGQVAGWSDTEDGEKHAFRTQPNQPINPATDDLGTLVGGHEAYAWGINNAGSVVGRSSVSRIFWGRPRVTGNVMIPPEWRAFLHDGKQMLDLNTLIPPSSGWVLYEARDINDRGQIVGDGICPEGYLHGFLLTPVPEPGQPVLLVIATAVSGLGFLGFQSRQGG